MVGAKTLSISRVDLLEITEINKENGGFDDVCEGEGFVLEDNFDVIEHAFGLSCDVAVHQCPGAWVERNLSGRIEKVPDLNGVVVGAKGLRGCFWRKGSFCFHACFVVPLKGLGGNDFLVKIRCLFRSG